MATFVLIHGAWHGGWCWERLTPLLEQAGHGVVAPDLPGMGSDPSPLGGVTLAGWARWVADLVAGQGEPVILVGHSRGGVVVSQAAELVPDRVACLVYLAAFLVPDGASMISTRERFGQAAPRAGLIVAADGTTTVAPEAIGPAMYNCSSDRDVAGAVKRFCAEPGWVFGEPLGLSDRFAGIPRAYIETTEDQAIPIALQRSMVAQLSCDPVVTLATDHSPFYSAVERLADALIGIGERFGTPATAG